MATPDRKHWSAKSSVKHDELRDSVEWLIDWVAANRAQAAGILGVAVAAVLAAGLVVYARRARTDAAWDKLTQAEEAAASSKPQEAQALLAQVYQDGGSAAAGSMALLLEGDMHHGRAEYDQALASYDKASEQAPETLKPFALSDKILTLEAAGKAEQCVSAAQSFLDATPDHLLAPLIHACLARCQLAEGQADAAKATLQKISLQYANTPWDDWAKGRLASVK